MHNTHKTSVSIQNTHREWLSQIKNRSKIINAALALYHERANKIQEAEQVWIDQSVQQWLEDIQNNNVIAYDGIPGDTKDLHSFLTNLANS